MDAKEVKKVAYDLYMAVDGGMKIDPKERRAPFKGSYLYTAGNDNPILFLAEFFALLDHHVALDSRDVLIAFETLNRYDDLKQPGNPLRHPSNYIQENSHDNIVGAASLSVISGLQYHKKILDHGIKNGFMFYAVKENAPVFQAKDAAFLKLINFYRPSYWEYFNLWTAIAVSSFQKNHDHLVMWLRLKTLDVIWRRHLDDIPSHFRFMYENLLSQKDLFKTSLLKAGGIGKKFETYFHNPLHPNQILSQGLHY